MLDLPARRFTQATGLGLLVATLLLGLGLERLAHGATRVGLLSLAAGGLVTAIAFSLQVEGDPGQATLMLVTRDECAHCEEARAILRDMQSEYGFALWEVDVDEDEELRERWREEVPVLVEDGRVLARLEVRPEDVERALGNPRETAGSDGEKANP